MISWSNLNKAKVFFQDEAKHYFGYVIPIAVAVLGLLALNVEYFRPLTIPAIYFILSAVAYKVFSKAYHTLCPPEFKDSDENQRRELFEHRKAQVASTISSIRERGSQELEEEKSFIEALIKSQIGVKYSEDKLSRMVSAFHKQISKRNYANLIKQIEDHNRSADLSSMDLSKPLSRTACSVLAIIYSITVLVGYINMFLALTAICRTAMA